MEQLSDLDASFLILENKRTPLHVGGTFVFRKPSEDKAFNFNRFRDLIESKLGSEKFFRKRVQRSTLNLEQPVWVDDADFDLNNHLSYITLRNTPSPCTLAELSASIFGQSLDRRRPLWHVSFVDGLENEPHYDSAHFALIIRIHIAAIDAASGEDILSKLLHVSPGKEALSPPTPWQANVPDTTSHWLDEAYNNALSIPKKLAGLALDTASSAVYGALNERLRNLNLPEALLSAPATPFNKKISSKRVVDSISISAESIRSIRQSLKEVTTNDIIMGVCAEALHNYLSETAKLPSNSLIALSPISVRSTSLDVKSGNQLAASLFSLATTQPDPIQRIRQIHSAATSSSHYDAAISAARLTELIPSCMAALSARVYSEFLLAQKYKPMFNLPITNIPGPQFPLFLEENELVEQLCAAPLFDGIGMSLTIVSYNGKFNITCTYCPDLLGQEMPFSTFVERALERILILKDEFEGEPQDNKEQTGLIEDVVGLVNNLFTFGSRSNNESAEKQKS